MNPQNEIVMYLVFREDLKMTKGKIAAQAGHAVQLILRKLEPLHTLDIYTTWAHEWENASYTKIALRADGTQFTDLCARLALPRLHQDDIPYAVVTDEGRTNVPPGSVTALAIAPMPRDVAHKYVGELKLY